MSKSRCKHPNWSVLMRHCPDCGTSERQQKLVDLGAMACLLTLLVLLVLLGIVAVRVV